MPFSFNAAISVLLALAQAIVQFTDLVPLSPKYKGVAIGAHLAVEFLLKTHAAVHNTDGTPQAAPYIPKGKL